MRQTQRKTTKDRGYAGAWPALRRAFLAAHPLCVECRNLGRVTAATVVDHVVPLAKALDRRLDPSNLQSLCASCHNRHKQRLERSGRVIGCDVNGVPLDPGHDWNAGG